MAPNYSKLAQALFVHEQLLTVILILFRRRGKRKYPFWVHNMVKDMTPTRCTLQSNIGCIMENCSLTQDDLISHNRSYRDLQTSWLDFVRNLATSFLCCESLVAVAWIAPLSRKKIQHASTCRSASALCTWNQAFTFPCFQFFPLPPLLPCCCHAAHMDSWLKVVHDFVHHGDLTDYHPDFLTALLV